MKTFIIALIMATMMITNTLAADFLTVVDNVPFCPDPETAYHIGYNAKLIRDGVCATVPRSTKFEILRFNSDVAEVMFYDQKDQLIQEPVWVETMHINKRHLTSTSKSLAVKVAGSATPAE